MSRLCPGRPIVFVALFFFRVAFSLENTENNSLHNKLIGIILGETIDKVLSWRASPCVIAPLGHSGVSGDDPWHIRGFALDMGYFWDLSLFFLLFQRY